MAKKMFNKKGEINMNIAIFVFLIFVIGGVSVFLFVSKNKSVGGDAVVDEVELDTASSLDNTVDTAESTESEDVKISESNQTSKTYSKAPQQSLVAGKNYKAVIKTNRGDLTIDLFEEKTPITVNNFVFLANEGFYNQTKAHRIIKEFMVQMGDPLTANDGTKAAWGTGDPGYRFDDEEFEGEYTRGVVAMANSGANTNGSQFFIIHKETPLPKSYVIFGEVSDDASLGVLDTIANTPVVASASGELSLPAENVAVESIEILTE